jgi:ABC-2 type transport system permease protein
MPEHRIEMRNPARTPFGAIFQAEVLLNSKRVAPYLLMVVFSANAILWWGWGAAIHYGWATNSEFYIIRCFGGFSFMTLPLFTALMMGDPVIRDFRAGVDPLIFSKPVGRAEYLLGKFFGNFFVLVCCQAAFALTLFLLQAFHPAQMVVQPARVFAYFQHFFILIVISHLVLAAVYFTVGTLTRNAKIVYALGLSFYPLYIAFQLFLKGFAQRWRIALDPLLFNWPADINKGRSADWLNQHVFAYDSDALANRALMLLITAACLTILYARFVKARRPRDVDDVSRFATLNLNTGVERLYQDPASFQPVSHDPLEKAALHDRVTLPPVSTAVEGWRANLKRLIAALGTEFRLLRAERSLLVIVPLVIFLSTLELAFYEVVPDVSYSAAYASNTAKNLLLFIFGMTVFYTGEAMHRDRELRIEPVLWSMPAPNYVLLLSKFFATLSLTLSLIALVALTAIALQIYKGHMPVEIAPYLIIYSWILIPSIAFIAAASIMLNAVLRDKYLVYAVSIATGVGMYYLYGQGYNHWLYNPALYQLWTYNDLTHPLADHARLVTHRIYFLALTIACLSLAHLSFERKAAGSFHINGRLSNAGWSILQLFISLIASLITAFIIASSPR